MWNRSNYTTSNLNQYTSFNWIDFVYDDLGNLKQNDKYTFTYDYKNRLIQAQEIKTWNIIKYEYDVLGRRVSEEKEWKTTTFVYSFNDIISEYITESGITLNNEYVYWAWIDELLVSFRQESKKTIFCYDKVLQHKTEFQEHWFTDIITSCEDTLANPTIVTNTYYYHTNHIRTVMWVSDSNWILVDSYEYDSFWNLIDFESSIGNTRLFTGREYDVDTGLYYNRARYYDPELLEKI